MNTRIQSLLRYGLIGGIAVGVITGQKPAVSCPTAPQPTNTNRLEQIKENFQSQFPSSRIQVNQSQGRCGVEYTAYVEFDRKTPISKIKDFFLGVYGRPTTISVFPKTGRVAYYPLLVNSRREETLFDQSFGNKTVEVFCREFNSLGVQEDAFFRCRQEQESLKGQFSFK
ncbi:MAG: hypothetical protein SFU25_00120 [Candidatus Caenarcaniphilales bacterium]|nr:hypothetical protein [Candidatus Caenarcaniphilales bacterium]